LLRTVAERVVVVAEGLRADATESVVLTVEGAEAFQVASIEQE